MTKILTSQLDRKPTFRAINTGAVPVIKYSAGIADWTQSELQELDRKTRQKLKLSGCDHPQADVVGSRSQEEVVHNEENVLTAFIEQQRNRCSDALLPHGKDHQRLEDLQSRR